MGVHHEVDTFFDLFLGEGRVTKQDCRLTELFRVLWQIMTFDAVQMNALRGGILIRDCSLMCSGRKIVICMPACSP